MTTGRVPRHPPSDFSDRPRTSPGRAPDTLKDEPALAVGSDGELDAVDDALDVVLDAAIDAPATDPRSPRFADLEGRVTALEHTARRKSLLRTWGERIVSALAGSAVVALAWVMTKAEAQGDARATAREHEAERRWLVETVRALDRRDALQQGQIDGLIDRLRYPMQGPPTAPISPAPHDVTPQP